MAGIWGAIDTAFPDVGGGGTVDAKLASIQDYLYMLKEQLGHTLRNLDMERNMNRASVTAFTGRITEPLTARIEGAEGRLTELSITAEGLVARVTNAEGSISVVSQKADRIDWVVSSGGNASSFTLTSRMTTLIAERIELVGYVTISSLQTPGTTNIDGGNLTSGTITGSTLRSIADSNSSEVWIRNGSVLIFGGTGTPLGNYYPAGGLVYDTNGRAPDAQYRLLLYSNTGTALKIMTLSGNMSIEAQGVNNRVYAMGNWDFSGANVIGLP